MIELDEKEKDRTDKPKDGWAELAIVETAAKDLEQKLRKLTGLNVQVFYETRN